MADHTFDFTFGTEITIERPTVWHEPPSRLYMKEKDMKGSIKLNLPKDHDWKPMQINQSRILQDLLPLQRDVFDDWSAGLM